MNRGRLPAIVSLFLLAGCGGTVAPTTAPATVAPAATPPPSAPATARPSPRADFVATMCPDAPGDPWLVVALGTSESREPSPQKAYPAQYAQILCDELDLPVELHLYVPGNWGPLAYWIDRVTDDEQMRADLAAADVDVLWALSSHDALKATVPEFGGCRGDWPDPLKACLEGKAANIPSETDELFGLIAGLVGDDAIVLAVDAYAPPAVVASPSWNEPYGLDIARLVDPYYSVDPMAAKHGFTFVDTEVVFNGPSRREMPAEGLFQSDGLHPTEAGALLTAQTYAEADGLGD
jgi:hypothetical protein